MTARLLRAGCAALLIVALAGCARGPDELQVVDVTYEVDRCGEGFVVKACAVRPNGSFESCWTGPVDVPQHALSSPPVVLQATP